MRVTSAISEGINNKIKRLKRMAYGYKDVTIFYSKFISTVACLARGFQLKYEWTSFFGLPSGAGKPGLLQDTGG
jgi:hypothetical protein